MKKILLFSALTLGFFVNAVPCDAQTASWVQTDTTGVGLFIYALMPYKNFLIACPSNEGYHGLGLIYKTTNSGLSWDDIGTGGGSTSYMYCIASDSDGVLYSGTSGGPLSASGTSGIYRSTDEGKIWVNVHPNTTLDAPNSVFSIATNSKKTIFATDYFYNEDSFAIIRSYDKGATWQTVRKGDNQSRYTNLSVDKGDNIYMTETSDAEGGIWISKDDGTTWARKNGGLPALDVLAPVMVLPNGSIYAGLGQEGVYSASGLTSDFVAANTGLATYAVISFLRSHAGRLFAGTFSNGVFYSDDGMIWKSLNTGLANYHITSLAEVNSREYSTVFCGTWGGGVYRLSSFNSVKENNRNSETNIYPNPISSRTTFSFTLSQEEFTTLKIYNSLGKEAATLINNRLAAGDQRIEFDASHLPSGVYYYRLKIGDHLESKKLIVEH